jgi:hypothetical protein
VAAAATASAAGLLLSAAAAVVVVSWPAVVAAAAAAVIDNKKSRLTCLPAGFKQGTSETYSEQLVTAGLSGSDFCSDLNPVPT